VFGRGGQASGRHCQVGEAICLLELTALDLDNREVSAGIDAGELAAALLCVTGRFWSA
jgi:hypothetical protein